MSSMDTGYSNIVKAVVKWQRNSVVCSLEVFRRGIEAAGKGGGREVVGEWVRVCEELFERDGGEEEEEEGGGWEFENDDEDAEDSEDGEDGEDAGDFDALADDDVLDVLDTAFYKTVVNAYNDCGEHYKALCVYRDSVACDREDYRLMNDLLYNVTKGPRVKFSDSVLGRKRLEFWKEGNGAKEELAVLAKEVLVASGAKRYARAKQH